MDKVFELPWSELHQNLDILHSLGHTVENMLALISLAKQAKKRSYAPYSHFNVGAAALFTREDGGGRMFTGANQENAAYSPTFCAECVAIMDARNSGYHELHMIAVCGAPDSSVSLDTCIEAASTWVAPCGRCRQVMAETAHENCLVVLVRGDNEVMGVRFSELFPLSFGPKNLDIVPSEYRP